MTFLCKVTFLMQLSHYSENCWISLNTTKGMLWKESSGQLVWNG